MNDENNDYPTKDIQKFQYTTEKNYIEERVIFTRVLDMKKLALQESTTTRLNLLVNLATKNQLELVEIDKLIRLFAITNSVNSEKDLKDN